MKKIFIAFAVCILVTCNVSAKEYWCDMALYTPGMSETSFCKYYSDHPMCKTFFKEVIKAYKEGTCKEAYIKKENVYGANCEIIMDKNTHKKFAHKCTDSDGSVNYAAMDKIRELYK